MLPALWGSIAQRIMGKYAQNLMISKIRIAKSILQNPMTRGVLQEDFTNQ